MHVSFAVLNFSSIASSYWTDLLETTKSVPGTWEWGDGTPLHYPSTDPWYPDKSQTASYLRAVLRKRDTFLRDLPSSMDRHFICEK